MYIVNQENNKVVKMEDVKITSRHAKEIQEKLDEIYNRISEKMYNYGSSERCKKAIKDEQQKFLIGKEKEYIIVVNGLDFAIYSTEQKAQEKFHDITNAINENKNIYYLR